MHIPESLQDLADSEAVQFLKRPKTVTRVFAGVSPPGPGDRGCRKWGSPLWDAEAGHRPHGRGPDGEGARGS